MTRTRLTSLAAVAVALAVVVAAGVVVWQAVRGDGAQTRLAQALRVAPPEAVRFSWTDWSGVRRAVGLDLDAASPAPAIDDLLSRGFEADLTPSSALVTSATVMQERLGFSPATLDWELFSQATGVASLTLRAGPEVDFDAVARSLAAEGYDQAPGDPVWFSDPTTDAITAAVTPELIYVELDPEASMIYASDTSAGLDAAVDAAEEGTDELPTGLSEGLVDAAGAPLTASLYTGAQVCSALAMAQADPTDAEAGEALVEAAGEVNPLTGFAIGEDAAGDVRVTMSLANADQARVNAETRAILASGPAPGQGGDFTDRFTLESATATGEVVVLELRPVRGSYVLSDLSAGPLLFATC